MSCKGKRDIDAGLPAGSAIVDIDFQAPPWHGASMNLQGYPEGGADSVTQKK
jgi:hypothetical protein